MPQTHALSASDTGLAPVPVAVLLPPVGPEPLRSPAGLSVHTACRLLTVYTSPGDLVLDATAGSSVAAAAEWLDRQASSVTDGDQRAEPVRLVIARLPLHDGVDLGALAEWMRRCRTCLRPGGFLVAEVPAADEPARYADRITTAVAGGRAAGLSYRQRLIDVRSPLPEHHPRAAPDTSPATATRLAGGRHVRAHADLVVFARQNGTPDA